MKVNHHRLLLRVLFKVKIPLPESLYTTNRDWMTIDIKATQILLTSNNATTEHKLQKVTLEAVYIPM